MHTVCNLKGELDYSQDIGQFRSPPALHIAPGALREQCIVMIRGQWLAGLLKARERSCFSVSRADDKQVGNEREWSLHKQLVIQPLLGGDWPV